MKHITILLFTLNLSLAAHSQYESAFGDSITSWNVLDGYPDALFNDSIVTIGDTIADGIGFKKLIWFTVDENLSNLTFYLREDTVAGKIWCRVTPDSEEILVSDLSLEPGVEFAYPPVMTSNIPQLIRFFIRTAASTFDFTT